MNFKLIAAVSLLVIAAGSQSVFATPLSASMNLTATAEFIPGAIVTNNDSETWGVPLSNLATNTSATATDPTAGFSAEAFGSGAASWGAGGNSGSVSFSYGWTINDGVDFNPNVFVSLTDLSLVPDWTYSFRADSDGVFSMNYLVTSTGPPFGLGGWDIGWSGAGGGLTLINISDPDTSGVFLRNVVAGSNYTVSLLNEADIGTDGGEYTSMMFGQFDFNIAAVPEPASLALFGIGLVGLGFSRRRKQ